MHLVHLDDVPPQNQDKSKGWAISTFRLPISGADGSTSTLFHGLFRPGSEHAIHLHDKSDELCFYIRGEGLVGAGEDRLRIGPGTARLMPRTLPHFFHNASVGEPAEVFGIYVGAGSVAETGYAFCGKPTEEDFRRCEESRAPREHVVTKVEDSEPIEIAELGWNATDFRAVVGTRNSPAAFGFAAKVAPGGGAAKRRYANADLYYFLHEGDGEAGGEVLQFPVRAGHFWWVPAGEEHWIRNTGAARRMSIFGYAVGVGGPEELKPVASRATA